MSLNAGDALKSMAMLILADRGREADEYVQFGPGPLNTPDSDEYEGIVGHVERGSVYAILANEDETGHVLIEHLRGRAAQFRHKTLEITLYGVFTTGGRYGNPAVMFNGEGELIRTHGELNRARETFARALREIADEVEEGGYRSIVSRCMY